THFLQIWIEPAQRGMMPSYEQKHFDVAARRGRVQPIAAGDARDGSVRTHQDAIVLAGLIDGSAQAELQLAEGRRRSAHVARGSLSINGVALHAGDAAKFVQQTDFTVDHGNDAEVLLFDLA